MAIETQCVHCNRLLKLKDKCAGLSGECPFCKGVITVPQISAQLPLATSAEPASNTTDNKEAKFTPPTKKQLDYARKLSIDTAGMSKDEVSAEISEAERRNPSLGKQREHANAAKRAKQHGLELIKLEQDWQKLADSNKWIVAVYQSGKATKADVICVNGAALNDKGALMLECEIAKVKKDRYLGQIVDVGRYIELPLSKIKWYEVVDEIEIEDVGAYMTAMQRAEAAVRKL